MQQRGLRRGQGTHEHRMHGRHRRIVKGHPTSMPLTDMTDTTKDDTMHADTHTSGRPPRLTVVGTGYLGATHAVCMATLGYQVLGVDVGAAKVDSLVHGRVPLDRKSTRLYFSHVAISYA